MSSMTIDQLKKSLTEQGITLPPSRSKKADYLKLYKQHSTINDTLGDVYSSDDDNPPKSGSQSVSSSTSPGTSESIAKEVEQLTDDELYNQLKEFDVNIGPVLKNTRRVYEKRLIKLLGGKGTNGLTTKTTAEITSPSVDEFSDSDIEIISKSSERSESKSRKDSQSRDSPKPSIPESSKPDTDKSFLSSYEYGNRSSTPNYSSESKTSRYSYIETIPRGSSIGYIEHGQDIGFSSDLRQRFSERYNADKFNSEKYNTRKTTADDIYKPSLELGETLKPDLSNQFKSNVGSGDPFKARFGVSGHYKPSLGISNKSKPVGAGGEHYIGSWEPDINRYLGTGAQKKNLSKSYSCSGLLKTVIAAMILFVILLSIFYAYQQWSSTDPYKMIEDDAERTIQQLSEETDGY